MQLREQQTTTHRGHCKYLAVILSNNINKKRQGILLKLFHDILFLFKTIQICLIMYRIVFLV